MRLSQLKPTTGFFLLALPYLASALTLGCDHVIVKDKEFHFDALDGDRAVSHVRDKLDDGGVKTNTTYYVNICRKLNMKSYISEKQWRCKDGTHGKC
jgi:hypothetical protein